LRIQRVDATQSVEQIRQNPYVQIILFCWQF
jgi:hypothetical protein